VQVFFNSSAVVYPLAFSQFSLLVYSLIVPEPADSPLRISRSSSAIALRTKSVHLERRCYMGADLYLRSVFQPNFDRYEPQFEDWVRRRNELQKRGKLEEAKAAQKEVETYHDRMYEHGYFRDSYNPTNLLWLFGLSWWEDIGSWLNDEGELAPDKAQAFLHLLAEREAQFETNLAGQIVWEDWTKAEMETYFREKYERLKVFLKEAIDRNEAIECSI
jgi:hypothetical protein